MNKTFIALCTLIGSAIGAGVLGIPYVIMRSGFSIGLFHLIFIAIIMTITMLYL
jgi:amino acid permease